ncbi:MAG: anion permease, partial [Sulfuricurvum sp.]|nr:anion permease [Sulfuricurvum sp.]
MSPRVKQLFPVLLLGIFALLLWFTPPPLAITPKAWQLFTIFLTTIIAILGNVLPIITASVIALAVSVLTGVIEPAKAYAGFSESFILLIV